MITAKQKALLIMILSVIGVLCVYSMRYPLENSRAAIQHQLNKDSREVICHSCDEVA